MYHYNVQYYSERWDITLKNVEYGDIILALPKALTFLNRDELLTTKKMTVETDSFTLKIERTGG